MKKIYSKPSVSVVNVRLFGSVLEGGPEIGVGNNSVETEEGFAKANDEVVDDEDDFGYNPMQTDWSTE